MARKQKDVVSYFPHYADASTRDTLTVLQSRFGNDGYAFWFKLLEKLASNEGHFLDCNNSNTWQLLLARTGVNEIAGVEIMKLLVEMQAIDKELWESKLIWCQKLVDNISDVYKNRRREIPQKPITTDNYPISTDKKGITTDKSTQSKVNKSKLLPPKGGQRKAPSQEKIKKDSAVNNIFSEMRGYLGYHNSFRGEANSSAADVAAGEAKKAIDPIPNYGKEGQAIKRMLTRGFTREEIMECWKSKVSQRGGEFVSMTWVNEDIGKPKEQRRGARRLSTDEEIAASIKEATTWHGDK